MAPPQREENDYDMDCSDNEVSPEQHSKLLAAVSQLDDKQRIKAPLRNEPSLQVSEYHLARPGKSRSSKVNLRALADALETRGHFADIARKVHNVRCKGKTLPKPLEKPVAERIKRSVGFANLKKQVSRWDAVVEKNRAANNLSFPANKGVHMRDTREYFSKFKTKSELESKIDEITNASRVVQEERNEAAQEFELSLEELAERRIEMARLRAQQSYQEAKARRQGKIKSKTYHRIQRRELVRQQLKKFEELKKTDPEAALEQLEQLERARAEERMTLRHRNTGLWARNRAVRAKYDGQSRQALAEQLALSRELTKKLKPASSSDDDEMDDTNTATDTTTNVENSDNPWIPRKPFRKAPSDDEVEEEEKNVDNDADRCMKDDTENDSQWTASGLASEGPSLKMKSQTRFPEEDEPMMEEAGHGDQSSSGKYVRAPALLQLPPSSHEESKQQDDVDPNKFLSVKPKLLQSQVPNLVTGGDDVLDNEEEDHEMTITEAFAGDDVVADFSQEKEEAIEKSKPEDIDLSLPGWGSWAGKGVPEDVRKKRRFVIQVPKEVPRRDENKGNLIINEGGNTKIRDHQVSQLPFPFTKVKDFEASIRAPIGNTWVPETAHSILIKPQVRTKLGTIIQPMDEDALVDKKKKKKPLSCDHISV